VPAIHPQPIVDLNADLGEGFGIWTLGDDEALLGSVTSANVACGFHAGDASTMRRVCDRAVEHHVAIGAQVGYRDLAGFGRRRIDIEPAQLADEILYQIGALEAFALAAGDRVRYVKPHGALYTTAITDSAQAGAIVAAIRRHQPSLPVLGMPDSELLKQAENAGLATIAEAFADRAYTAAGRLLARGQAGAVLDDVDSIVERCVTIAGGGAIATADGGAITIAARSICVHGDTPGAATIALRVRDGLEAAGVMVRAFSPPDH
jgi:UPF0271 protein